ncbi:HNH endonuclease [Streptomyces sp. MAA16]|uniref:HNH endonuclease n=1 Tax=Streptomyces sp. MAA16 TaxID=3035116 RepID=UPI002474CF3E|nr:HNH endonuclease [Streptomyces sp. MAA16]MDH6700430.1 superfamily II DNA or RNA helicase [Streptomyces sp. MAA16]
MVERDPQRLFSQSQRNILYDLAEGRCQRCSAALGDGWQADHMAPWADGGRTEIENGQALCELCNRRKGRQVHYTDEFDPRPFQREVSDQVFDRIHANEKLTVVLASPGSGKTLAYQGTGTRLFRADLIDHVAIFVPRVSLAEQCETGWMYQRTGSVHGLCTLFDATKRLGKIRHKVKEKPLTPLSEPGSGFVSTYSALVTNASVFLEWARRHEGRFLLVADEAQFCGDSKDEEGGGTKAGELIKQMHEFSRHTLLLTGTPNRADNQPLILADYEPHLTNPRRRVLIHHAEASYANGIAEGYLRKFEMQRTNARVAKRTLGAPDTGAGDTLLEYNLSDDGSELIPVLRDEKVWKPLVDDVVRAVRDKQKFNSAYRGLISCMQQADAKKVQKYLQQRYPDLRVALAVSSDANAPQELADFKVKQMDLLVTVRMAFIGYDCPQITVVGILTNYRDGGHLSQLVGRGLRVWKDMPPREQSCVIVAPDDPKMQGFLDLLREQNDEGVKIFEEREEQEKSEGSEPVQEELSFIESAVATDTRAASNEVDMDADETLMVEHIKRAVDSAETVTTLKRAIELAGVMLKQNPPVPAPRPQSDAEAIAGAPKTERQEIADFNAKTSEAINQYLYRSGVKPGSSGYQDAVMKATARVNEVSCAAGEANTVEKASRRFRAALALQ